ncbi:MAG: dTMP kinase [Patescibacteria group bacterium]
MRHSGKLIVIEGLDGTGKATQTKILFEKLKKEGFSPVVFDFPLYHTFWGKIVALYLHGEYGQVSEVNPYFSSILYSLDRWQIKDKIRKFLKDRKIVIANRYSTSNFLYQSVKLKKKKEKEIFLKWLEKIEYKFFGLPKPDLVIYLKLPYYLSRKLLKKKNKKFDHHEKNEKFLKMVEKNSSFIIKKYHWKIVPCEKNKRILSKKEIAEKIWKIVYPKIANLKI